MLYAARAALSESDRSAKTHRGVWNLFQQSYVDAGRFDQELLREARASQRAREATDYDAGTSPPRRRQGSWSSASALSEPLKKCSRKTRPTRSFPGAVCSTVRTVTALAQPATSADSAAGRGPHDLAAGHESPEDHRRWREQLAPYAKANRPRALLCLATSVVPYLGLSVAMYLTLEVSYLLTLALVVPTAIFLVRTFIVFTTARTGPSCHRGAPTLGWGSPRACCCTHPSSAGATTMRSTTRAPVTSIAAAPGTFAR